MKNRMGSFIVMLIFILNTVSIFAQQSTTVSGNVKNSSTQEGVSAVSVKIKGTTTGSFTDENGNFKFTTSQKPPFILVITSVGYSDREINFRSNGMIVNIEVTPTYALGDEVVVAASRVPERILESPVSIERVSAASIRNAAAPGYYDVLANLKGVDITTASLTFKSVSTRGFNSSGNLRLNQVVDGMDNQAPGLNFSVGNIVGLTELDVENMELLSGASSALYGSGGMNGTLLINSKDPFKYQGLSFQVKQGIKDVDNFQRSAGPYYDWSVRWAYKLTERFAYKIGAQFVQAKDWLANNKSDYSRTTGSPFGQVISGNRNSDPNYDGVNVYGDETTQQMTGIASSVRSAAGPTGVGAIDGLIAAFPTLTLTQLQTMLAGNPAYSPLLPYVPIIYGSNPAKNYFGTTAVSRTGYDEKDVVEPNTVNIKLSGGLYYKFSNKLEGSLTANWGTGNTVYTGSDRYVLKNLKIGQYKLEFKSKNWYLRGYTTQENSGDSYNATIAARYFNEAWKPSTTWYPTYLTAFASAVGTGQTPTAAHALARSTADQGRPSGPIYDNPLFKNIVQTPISKGGALFLDKTSLYAIEGQYNLTDAFGLAKGGTEVLIGGNSREFVLNSKGTLFADTAGNININESGAYIQVSQKLFKDVLKLSASGRYDKNANFNGRFTPRASAVVKLAKDHFLRFSYQEAYRFPSTQNQWISLVVSGNTILSGGLQQMIDYYKLNSSPVYNANGLLAFKPIKPETSSSFEFGYKGQPIKNLLLDAYVYYATYNDFITSVVGVQPATGKSFSVAQNALGTVNTDGWGVSGEYLLPHNFSINANVYSDRISKQPGDASFVSFFNTPQTRINIGFSNSGFAYKNRFGFNIVYKWQDSFRYEGSFAVGQVPAVGLLDAMISYKMSKIKSLLKIGAANVLNHYYINGFGNAQIGGLYYISFGYNVF